MSEDEITAVLRGSLVGITKLDRFALDLRDARAALAAAQTDAAHWCEKYDGALGKLAAAERTAEVRLTVTNATLARERELLGRIAAAVALAEARRVALADAIASLESTAAFVAEQTRFSATAQGITADAERAKAALAMTDAEALEALREQERIAGAEAALVEHEANLNDANCSLIGTRKLYALPALSLADGRGMGKMGMIRVELRGSFGVTRTEEFSAMNNGHASAVAAAIAYLVTEEMPKAIALDHKLHNEGKSPALGYAGTSVGARRG